MCLSEITKTLKPNDEEKVGYKVFCTGRHGGLYSEFPRRVRGVHCEFIRVRKNTWLKPEKEKILGTSISYLSGFHIFINKKDALWWRDDNAELCVRAVRYKRAYIIGLQPLHNKNLKVVVADRLFVGGK